MPQGTVKWFSEAKGYGFISMAGSTKHDKDVFVHYSGILGEGYKKLAEGDLVDFELFQGKKGLQAEKVKLVLEGERAAGV